MDSYYHKTSGEIARELKELFDVPSDNAFAPQQSQGDYKKFVSGRQLCGHYPEEKCGCGSLGGNAGELWPKPVEPTQPIQRDGAGVQNSEAAFPYGAPISKEELIAYRKRLFAKLDEVLLAKGNDYNSTQQDAGDTLFNLRVCAILGVVPKPEDGILVRLADKLMRVVSLTRPSATQKVKDESIEDTIGDAINYLSYLSAMIIKSRRGTL